MLKIELEREADGRRIAEAPAPPGHGLWRHQGCGEGARRLAGFACDRGSHRQRRVVDEGSVRNVRGVSSRTAAKAGRVLRALNRLGWSGYVAATSVLETRSTSAAVVSAPYFSFGIKNPSVSGEYLG